jgi:biotin transport system permease protein
MADLSIFHYISMDSVLHRIDPRVKLCCLVLYTVAGMFASLTGLILLSIVFIIALVLSKLPVSHMLREIRGFALILVFIILSRACNANGEQGINGSDQGIYQGLVLAWRLVLILVLGSILTGTTSLSKLRDAVEWFFRRIPFVPASRIAIMTGLTISLVPLVFDRASEISDAQKSRCIQQRKNPVKRIRFLISPLMSKTFVKAEEIAYAMESRCYNENRTETVFCSCRMDWVVLIFSFIVCGLVYLTANAR